MAKKKRSIQVQHYSPHDEDDCCFMLWVDWDMAGQVGAIEGVVRLDEPAHGQPWWNLTIDPRHGINDVIQEIYALRKQVEPITEEQRIEDWAQKLYSTAYRDLPRELNRRLNDPDRGSKPGMPIIRAYLAEEALRGAENQKEPTLKEQARQLGRKTGEAGWLYSTAKDFLIAADENYVGSSLENALLDLSGSLAYRIEHGHW